MPDDYITLTIPIVFSTMHPFVPSLVEIAGAIEHDDDEINNFRASITDLTQISTRFPFITNISYFETNNIPGFGVLPGFVITLKNPPDRLLIQEGIHNGDWKLSRESVFNLRNLFNSVFWQPQAPAWDGINATFWLVSDEDYVPAEYTSITIGGQTYNQITWDENRPPTSGSPSKGGPP